MVEASYKRCVSLHYLHDQSAVLNVSVFAFQNKEYIGCCMMNPWDGVVRIQTEGMRVLGDTDTHVSRHGRDIERLRSSGLGVLLKTSDNPLEVILDRMLNLSGAYSCSRQS